MNLTTRYLGLELRNPLLASASPLSRTVDGVRRLADAGVGAVVLYSLFEEQLRREAEHNARMAVPSVTLSTSAETRLPMTWIALLRGRVRASLAATTGVEHASDVIKYLLAGADVVQSASALLRHGPAYAGVLIGELRDWMRRKGFASVAEIRGLLALSDTDDRAARERADYVGAVRDANSRAYGSW
jgi:dihydroorotate dehydrogenase (fumarate)